MHPSLATFKSNLDIREMASYKGGSIFLEEHWVHNQFNVQQFTIGRRTFSINFLISRLKVCILSQLKSWRLKHLLH